MACFETESKGLYDSRDVLITIQILYQNLDMFGQEDYRGERTARGSTRSAVSSGVIKTFKGADSRDTESHSCASAETATEWCWSFLHVGTIAEAWAVMKYHNKFFCKASKPPTANVTWSGWLLHS